MLAVLRRRFPRADAYVEAAARAGEEGRVVRSRLGRACPPPSAEWRGLTASPDEPGADDQRARRSLRARGRFTRNFVVQASAADWALVLLAGLRRRIAAMGSAGPDGSTAALEGPGPGVLPARRGHRALPARPWLRGWSPLWARRPQKPGRLLFGATPVRFPVTTAVVSCYADAK